ncbi:LD-carboxypeptidase [Rurimicrobium arvi]|uniref:LD-carboxypeptidase n=1 Tax=Rurimicrobium arvi TaxID=2049916 RepID=A0ABP8MNT5_9BACT
MIVPPFLKPGSTIGITCPSGYVSADRVSYALKVLSDWGFKTVTGETVGNEYHYFSGDDATRARDLQQMLDDPAIDAILMGRGGYGLSRIIDTLDFTHFSRHPKWICGFSDITVLHSHIQACFGIPTLHSVMCGAFRPETERKDYLLSLQDALSGKSLQYDFSAFAENKPGTAEGVLVGGNLAMLAHLTGSVSQVDAKDKILFIEDIGEHYYQVDRMLLNLKRSGQLSRLKALLVGSFTDMQDTDRPFGQSIEEIILDKVREYDYPVAFGFPCGHQEENVTLMLGAAHKLTVAANGSVLALQPH